MDGNLRDGESIRDAERTAMAFHEPNKLAEERRVLLKRAGLEMPAAEALALAREELEKLKGRSVTVRKGPM